MEVSKNSKMVKFSISNSNKKEHTESLLQSNNSKINECTNPALKIKQEYLKPNNKDNFSNTNTDKVVLYQKRCKYKLLDTLSIKLSEILNSNIREEKLCPEEFAVQNDSYFYSTDIPDISLKDYLRRLAELSKAEFSTCMLLSIYVDRFCEAASFHLTWNTVYR